MPALLTRMSSVPNASFGLREEAADVGLLGDVGLDGDGLAALAGDLGDDAVGPLLAGGVVDDHRRPFGGEVLRDRRPDALGRAGDDGDLAREFLRHGDGS